MKHHQVTGLVGTSGQFEHAPGGVGTDDQQPIVGIDHAHGVGSGMPDRVVADAMTAR